MEDGGGDRTSDDAMNPDAYYPAAGDDPVESPVARNRSNTWHGPPDVTPKGEAASAGDAGPEAEFGPDGECVASGNPGSGSAWKKGTARRNAWGNLSYADLITKAIESCPDQRMTLSQIYGWMVQNISFFKDKGESNSSAGWKNSIRHNLSLHNRFMRVQNEGTGKSSWWVINPDAKSVKLPRRRAATMDTKTYTGRRGRAQRVVTVSESTSSGDLLGKNDEHEMNTDYQNSLTSSGINMQPVTEMEDASELEFVPSSSSWTNNFSRGENVAETLSESLADIFVGNMIKDDVNASEFRNRINVPLSASLCPNSPIQSTFMTRSRPIMHPVISPRSASGETCDRLTGNASTLCNSLQMFGPTSFSPGINSAISLIKSPDATCHFANSIRPTQPTVDNALQLSSCSMYANKSNEMLQAEVKDKVIKPSSPNYQLYNQFAPVSNSKPLHSQFLLQLLADKTQLMAKMQHLIQTRQQQQQFDNPTTVPTHTALPNPVVSSRCSSSMLQQLLISSSDAIQVSSLSIDAPTLATSHTGASTFIPADLDLNFLDFDAADIDCDIDQVIKHELTFGENLDFAFDRTNDV